MARWPKPTKQQIATARRAVLGSVDLVGDTILPGDVPAVGRDALLGLAEEMGRGVTATYETARALAAQSWVVHVDGVAGTMVSSGEHWLTVQRHEETQALRRATGKTSGALPPKLGSRPRGRPRKQP